MSIIRNADDFGKSEDVNKAIVTGFREGYIDRTTLMVNMPYADDAVSEAKREGFSDKIGIHLNLTEGMPLTEGIKQNPLFCGPDGRFHALFCKSTKYRLYMDNLSRDQIYQELSAQLKKYSDYGLTLFHVDSHHHVHTNLPVFLALKSLAKEYDFSSVRLSRNLFHGGNGVMKIYKGIYNARVKRICKSVTDYFGSYIDLKEYDSNEGLTELVRKKTVEVMLHPMYKEGRLMDTDTPMEEVNEKISIIKQNLGC